MASHKRRRDIPPAESNRMKQSKLNFASKSRDLPTREHSTKRTAEPAGQENASKGQDSAERSTNTKEGADASKKNAAKRISAHSDEHAGNSNPTTKKTADDLLPAKTTKLLVKDVVGDIFDAPANTVLIHACNCRGHWGAGIAKAFADKYPDAFKLHRQHCRSFEPTSLMGTAQLIPPRRADKRQHWVGCLFTSVSTGSRRSAPEDIIEATLPAMEDLLQQMQAQIEEGERFAEVRICHINSGLFGVPWSSSREILESIEVADGKTPAEVMAYSQPNLAVR